MNSDLNYCVIIPAYREGGRIAGVIREVLGYAGNIVVVDDGSPAPDTTSADASAAGAFVLRHDVNLGKGAALETGFRHAVGKGYDFVITMDGDGQHDPSDIPLFLDEFVRKRTPVIVGNRMDDPVGMPFVRRMTNRFMSWLLSREMGVKVPDTQSGYRLYRADVLPFIRTGSKRFAAESEVLLDLAALGYGIGSVPIRIIYRDERSKIRPVRDTILFFSMLGRHRGRRKPGAC